MSWAGLKKMREETIEMGSITCITMTITSRYGICVYIYIPHTT